MLDGLEHIRCGSLNVIGREGPLDLSANMYSCVVAYFAIFTRGMSAGSSVCVVDLRCHCLCGGCQVSLPILRETMNVFCRNS